MLNEICKDVAIEPRLQPITGEQMRYRTATSGDEVRLEARGFWRRNQAAFFDINVTHMNAASYKNLSQEQTLKNQENKKRGNITKELWSYGSRRRIFYTPGFWN